MTVVLIVWGISALCLYAYCVRTMWVGIQRGLSPEAWRHAGLLKIGLACLKAALPDGWVALRLYLLGPVGLLIAVRARL
ncbi:hypothetical protein GCM10008957_11140 [Deinococcus ruber]|uniref:Uncharacterized protein n=1 Tax=Deinococcus ruber TaxID=1848197 RepID=A0A918F1T5_9DEIO|nr:hypothetical protein GCM10008957_11140 [Deinococcus ruber]